MGACRWNWCGRPIGSILWSGSSEYLQFTLLQFHEDVRLSGKVIGMCGDYHAFVHLVGAFFQDICDL